MVWFFILVITYYNWCSLVVSLIDSAGSPKPLILVCGKYGSGKTTVAAKLHGHLPGYDRIGIDEMRQVMGLAIYKRQDNPMVLERMWSDTESALRAGRGVIVDRPHQTYATRLMSYYQGLDHGRPIIIIETVCPEHVAKARIAARPSSEEFHLPSNDPSIYGRIKRNWEDVEHDFRQYPLLRSELSHLRFDTALSKAEPLHVPAPRLIFIEKMCRILESMSSA